MGDRFGGYVLYLDGDRLHFDFNDFGKHTRLVSEVRCPRAQPPSATVTASRGQAVLLIDGREVAVATLTTTPSTVTTWSGMDVGRDVGSPVSDVYAERGSFPFTAGKLQRVELRLREAPAPR